MLAFFSFRFSYFASTNKQIQTFFLSLLYSRKKCSSFMCEKLFYTDFFSFQKRNPFRCNYCSFLPTVCLLTFLQKLGREIKSNRMHSKYSDSLTHRAKKFFFELQLLEFIMLKKEEKGTWRKRRGREKRSFIILCILFRRSENIFFVNLTFHKTSAKHALRINVYTCLFSLFSPHSTKFCC